MHVEGLSTPDLDIPVGDLELPEDSDLDIPVGDLDLPEDSDLDLPLEEMPNIEIDELLRLAPTVLSSSPTINQTLFTERICIRINRWVLGELKKRAAEQGVRYQTFINTLLAQQASI